MRTEITVSKEQAGPTGGVTHPVAQARAEYGRDLRSATLGTTVEMRRALLVLATGYRAVNDMAGVDACVVAVGALDELADHARAEQ